MQKELEVNHVDSDRMRIHVRAPGQLASSPGGAGQFTKTLFEWRFTGRGLPQLCAAGGPRCRRGFQSTSPDSIVMVERLEGDLLPSLKRITQTPHMKACALER